MVKWYSVKVQFNCRGLKERSGDGWERLTAGIRYIKELHLGAALAAAPHG